MTVLDALIIGLCQCVAVVPGLSAPGLLSPPVSQRGCGAILP